MIIDAIRRMNKSAILDLTLDPSFINSDESLYITGSCDSLGSWKVAKKINYKIINGYRCLHFRMSVLKGTEFKIVKYKGDSESIWLNDKCIWEKGENRIVSEYTIEKKLVF